MKLGVSLIIVALSYSLIFPACARGGFGGGGFRGGGFSREGGFGGRMSYGDFGNRFGRDDFNRGFEYGGLDNADRTARWGNTVSPVDKLGGGNFAGRDGIQEYGSVGSHLPTDGGFGRISNWRQNYGEGFKGFQNADWHNQAVRNSFDNYNRVNFRRWGYGYGLHRAWWGYPGAWYVPGWYEGMAWTCMGLTSLYAFLEMAALASAENNNQNEPSVNNVTYEGDNVFINGKPSGTAADYYQESQVLAASGAKYANNVESKSNYAPKPSDWKPLGVFSLAQKGQTDSSMLFQLAINKDGIIRGNYFNQLTNESKEVYGSLDKKTQRVSFSLGKDNSTVFDTSLSDLTKKDAPVLVHYSPQSTEGMMLVRVKQPTNTSKPATG